MLTYTLYFLLPLTSESPKVVSLAHPMQASSVGGNNDDESIMSGSVSVEPSSKKRKIETSSDFSDRPLSDLLREFFDAVDNNSFERKHSFISTAILSHAINDACSDPKLIDKCKNEGGLQRAEVIEWIENHEVYGRYVQGLLKHLEVRTYQQNLSRAMSKVGFERVGTSGRHVKWLIPGFKVDVKKEEASKPFALSKDDMSLQNLEQENDMADDDNAGESSVKQMDSSKLSAQVTENIEMQRSPEKNVSVTAEQEDSPPDPSTEGGTISDQAAGLKQQDPWTNKESQSGQQPNESKT